MLPPDSQTNIGGRQCKYSGGLDSNLVESEGLDVNMITRAFRADISDLYSHCASIWILVAAALRQVSVSISMSQMSGLLQ